MLTSERRGGKAAEEKEEGSEGEEVVDTPPQEPEFTKDEEFNLQEKIKELYRWVYSREPDSVETKIALGHLAKHEKDTKVAWEDIIWALINTKEFLFNH